MSQTAARRAAIRPAPETAAKAFHDVSQELKKLRPDDLVVLNFDVPQAVSTVLGASARIAELREQIAKDLPRTPIAAIDNLERYALAALYAHLVVVRASTADPGAKGAIEEARGPREDLLVAAEALAHAGLLDAQRARAAAPRGVRAAAAGSAGGDGRCRSAVASRHALRTSV